MIELAIWLVSAFVVALASFFGGVIIFAVLYMASMLLIGAPVMVVVEGYRQLRLMVTPRSWHAREADRRVAHRAKRVTMTQDQIQRHTAALYCDLRAGRA